jgi:hypothetical protein
MRGFWVFRQWRVLEKAGSPTAMKCPDCKIIGRRAPQPLPTSRHAEFIVSRDGNSLPLLFDERPLFSPEELIERSLPGDGWSLQLAYEHDLHDRQQQRLKELNAPEISSATWSHLRP